MTTNLGGPSAQGLAAHCLVHDALGRLTAVGPALARLSAPGASACQKEADLASVSARFEYDAFNRHAARQDGTAWTDFVHDPAGNLLAEVSRPSTPSGAWTTRREYVWLDGRPLAQLEYPGPSSRTDGWTYWFHLDHLGLPRAMSSEAGVTVWSATPVRPYGDIVESASVDPATGRTLATNLRLPGQYDERLLASVGLQGPYSNWHRWYLPRMGRYMELDPIAVQGGFSGSGWAPDWYNYVAGNPLSYIDPLGLDRISICLAKKLLRLYDDNGKERMKAGTVTGCEKTPTPTGKFKLTNWQKDPTTTDWGDRSKREWSKDWLGRNVFGPWFVELCLSHRHAHHGMHGERPVEPGLLEQRLRRWPQHARVAVVP